MRERCERVEQDVHTLPGVQVACVRRQRPRVRKSGHVAGRRGSSFMRTPSGTTATSCARAETLAQIVRETRA